MPPPMPPPKPPSPPPSPPPLYDADLCYGARHVNMSHNGTRLRGFSAGTEFVYAGHQCLLSAARARAW